MLFKKKLSLSLSIIFLLMAFIVPAYALNVQYYVGKNVAGASDSHNCTNNTTQVCLTISKGLSVMSSGDTLNIMAGTYNETISTGQLAGKSGFGFTAGPKAPALPNWGSMQTGTPTTIQAYQNDIIQTGSIGLAPANSGESLQYIVFKSAPRAWAADCQDSIFACLYLGGQGGFLRYIKVDGLEIRNVHASGTGLVSMGGNAQVGDHLWMTNTYVHHSTGCDITPGGPAHDAHGIYMETSDNLVEFTEITDVGGYGIHNYNETIATRPNNNVYRWNYIHDTAYSQLTQIGVDPPSCQQSAFAIGNGNASTVGTQIYGNLLVHNVQGIDLIEGHQNLVYNNTLFNNTTGTRQCSSNTDSNCDLPFWAGWAQIKTENTFTGAIKNNIIFGNGNNLIADGNGNPITGSSVSNNSTANPNFVNSSSPNCTGTNCPGFYPQSTNAIDKGTTAIATGVSIPACGTPPGCFFGSGPDIGAFETASPQRYVANGGTNSGGCTNISSPCQTIAYGISQMASGDTLNIRGGTYNEQITSTMLNGKSGTGVTTLPVNVSGWQTGNPTTIRAYQTEQVFLTRGIALQGDNGTTVRYVVFQGDPIAKNFIITPTQAIPAGIPAINMGQGGNTGVMDHIKFDGVEAKDSVSPSASVFSVGNPTQYVWVSNSKIHNQACSLDINDGFTKPAHVVYVGGGSNILLEFNEFFDAPGYGIHQYIDPIIYPTPQNVFRYNYIHDTGLDGSTRPCQSHVTAWGIGAYSVPGTTINNNTVINNWNGIDSSQGGSVIYNNTVYRNGIGFTPGSQYAAVKATTLNGVTIKNNIIFGNTDNSIDTTGSTNVASSNNLLANPSFVDTSNLICTNGDCPGFYVTGGNAINQGTTSITTGVNIPACSGSITPPGCYFGTAPDIGAFESGGGAGGTIAVAITQPTLSPTYVAPSTPLTTMAGNTTVAGGESCKQVTWASDRGPSGIAIGCANWSIPSIALFPGGDNVITVTATGAGGASGSSTLTVTLSGGTVLVGQWNFNEGTGPTAHDSSSFHNDGTLGAGVSWTNSGKYGSGLLFNGTGTGVTITGTPSLDLRSGITVEAWVNPDAAYSAYRAVMAKADNGWALYATEEFGPCIGGPSGYITNIGNACFATRIPPNQFSHMALTFDGSVMRLYINAQLVASTSSPGSMVATAGVLQIGASQYGELFSGILDELYLYSGALPLTSGGNQCNDAPSITRDMNCSSIAQGVTAIAVTSPANPFITTANSVTVNGTASCSTSIVSVTWVNDRGGTNKATNTTNWTANVPLVPDRVNSITFTVNCQ